MKSITVSERTWQGQVEYMLDLFHWRWYHLADWRSRLEGPRTTSYTAGFPDIIAVRSGEIIWMELKSQKGSLTKEQKEWIADLQAANQEVHVLRPTDFDWVMSRLK